MPQQYAIYDSGAPALIEYEGDEPPPLSEPGRIVTEAEYQQAVGVLQAARDERRAALETAEKANAQADYEALTAVGISEETARRLSRYEPEEADKD